MNQPYCNLKKVSRKAQDFQRREKAILAAALKSFGSDHWESVTVAQIAREVGIAKGTMYLHFASKQEIYARLALDFYQALTQHLDQPLTSNASDNLQELITRAFEFHLERPDYRRVTQYCEREDFRRNINLGLATAFNDIDIKLQRILSDTLLQGIKEGCFKKRPPQQTILGLQCTFHGALSRFWCNRNGEQNHPQEYVDQVANYMLETILDNHHPENSADPVPLVKKFRTPVGIRMEITS